MDSLINEMDDTYRPETYICWLVKDGRGFKKFEGVSELDAARAALRWLRREDNSDG